MLTAETARALRASTVALEDADAHLRAEGVEAAGLPLATERYLAAIERQRKAIADAIAERDEYVRG